MLAVFQSDMKSWVEGGTEQQLPVHAVRAAVAAGVAFCLAEEVVVVRMLHSDLHFSRRGDEELAVGDQVLPSQLILMQSSVIETIHHSKTSDLLNFVEQSDTRISYQLVKYTACM